MNNSSDLKRVEVEVGSDCNLSCDYCPNSKYTRKSRGLMSDAVFDKILSGLAQRNYGGQFCYHFYNEPLLRKDLPLLVKRTREALPKAFLLLYSNGTLLSKTIFEDLINAGIDGFNITKHKDIKKIPLDSFYAELPPLIQKKINYKDHSRLILSNRSGLLNFTENHSEEVKKRPCYIPKTTLVFTLNGNALPCYEDYQERMVLGNIMEESLSDILSGPKFLQFQRDLQRGLRQNYEICKSCDNRMLF